MKFVIKFFVTMQLRLFHNQIPQLFPFALQFLVDCCSIWYLSIYVKIIQICISYRVMTIRLIIRRNLRPMRQEIPPKFFHKINLCTGKSFSEARNICRTWCAPKLFWMSKQNKNNNLCIQHVLQVFWAYNFHKQWTICRHIVGELMQK